MGPLIHGCIGGLLLIIYISFRIHSCCSTIQEENEVMVVKSLENQKQMGKSHDIGFLAEAKSKYMHLSDLYEIDNQNASNCGEIIYSKLESNDIVDVSYCTWQEDGDRQPLKGEKVIYTCIPVIDLDRTMDNTLNTAYNAYLSRFCESEANRFVKLRYKPPQNFVYRAIAGNSFAFKYFTTIPYRIFYEILFFFGFNGISDFFWSYKAKRYIFYSQKKIGHEASSYRARYGERDLNPIINHEGGEISENYNSSKDENSMKMSLLNPYNENY
ncbi:hypothetical protein TVAG_354430 [Trichomonas vaginalis G3]|uniref:Uncharacterized protein n=1 Tax=Trichomonas vaginalis (strain ATCC PRA-98 / G3) TaxID=412133 RepID=A2F9D3_TRIV3|nr:hypothetical protein TVAGG3_0664480 [Trichomonas vaginalis G3]EAX98505.1 hypothetical protein TVAG_354430 [Trichomonas vaginalis G3]KAI5506742.1 hypothetical protein TVAGG3_0664480 [Trichomonas vaginalis G3]|eukprot:XP_001311435.1 hypothetical protein [Trichomonas vaginalis G3]